MITDSLGAAVAASGSTLLCSDASAVLESMAVVLGAAVDSNRSSSIGYHESEVEFVAAAVAAESAGDLFFADNDDDSF